MTSTLYAVGMFTESDYLAARVRDAARYLNEAVDRARRAGLTVSLRVESEPTLVTVELAPNGESRAACERRDQKRHQ
jgi:hypothetical protein